MSYTPTEWEPTDVVTATRMNALEQAVGAINMSYTPNVWTDGQVLTATKMNALEQAVANAGGGSSGLSTATMTLTVTGDPGADGAVYVLSSFGEIVPLYESFSAPTADVILVQGEVEGGFITTEAITTYSGAITLGTPTIEDDAYYTPFTMTGDCAVTLVGWSY